MMWKFSWMLLVLLVLVGCGDEFTENEERALKDLVKDEVVAGAEMVLIPGGSFEMGNHFGDGDGDELPVHTVELDEFYMDVHEVTVGQFREFVNQSGYSYDFNRADERGRTVAKHSPADNYPMVFVNWIDATAYAKWAGKRLPTEAEWEYAARGGLKGKRYPWGSGDPTGKECNFADTNADAFLRGIDPDWADLDVDDGHAFTAPVGSFAANGYGLYDMAGNVQEWCADWHGSDYYSESPASNPTGPASSPNDERVLRGGSWTSNTDYLRVDNRYHFLPKSRKSTRGFRCVSGLP
jgi:formylglycine-generating enzyme required for sulfatase activity